MAKLGCAQARQARRLSYIALCPTRVWTASFPRSGLAAILMQPPMLRNIGAGVTRPPMGRRPMIG